MNAVTRTYAVLRHAELHGLEDHISGIDARFNLRVQLFAGEGHSEITSLLAWARSLNADTVTVEPYGSAFHIEVRGILPCDLAVSVVSVVRDDAEAEALHDMAITGSLTLDQLAAFVREPEVIA